jgi:hypothetical protein
MYQELQYLRDELNQRLRYHFEHGNKTINIVLFTWGGVIVILGHLVTKSLSTHPKNAILCFIGATIFFVSNVIIHSLARKYYDSASHISKIAAYIHVFYERLPSSTVKVGENFCWESINFKIATCDLDKNGGRKNNFYKRNDEYRILNIISLAFIVFLSVALFLWWDTIGKILFGVCVFYTIFSIYLLFTISKYTSSKDNYGMKAKHLSDYFQYAIDLGYYTEQEIKERFGDTYENCKKYLRKQKRLKS